MREMALHSTGHTVGFFNTFQQILRLQEGLTTCLGHAVSEWPRPMLSGEELE